ncbi:hypothetical protein HPB47_009634 [Ixodes persulcatus]|uniref:Uncharacterized protein n=1 Tax=Ixodes persulcatus TaxID=34615 RepID=A0AC60P1D5_IXOPE|nr:hypothetical protein HPB47_009634 [Ixodes persulcatus]
MASRLVPHPCKHVQHAREGYDQRTSRCRTKAMKESKDWADIATSVKTFFEAKYGPTWFCVVGKDFGITGTCEMNRGGFVSISGIAVGIFKFK